MYIKDILIRDLVNFKGENFIKFSDGFDKGLPNELYVFVGQNNCGKSSLLQLIRACTDPVNLEKEWRTINLQGDNKKGIVLCRMITDDGQTVISGFYKKKDNNKALGVYIWATPVEGSEYSITDRKLRCCGNADYECTVKKTGATTSDTVMNKLCSFEYPDAQEFNLSSKPPQNCTALPIMIMSTPEDMQATISEYYLQATSSQDLLQTVNDMIQRIGYDHYALKVKSKPDKDSTQSRHVKIEFEDTNTKKRFDYKRLPEGHQYLWNLVIHMAHVKCASETGTTLKCMIMDEPTRCMHPSLVQHLSAEMKDYCREYKLQLIITSHSPAILRAVRLGNVYLGARMIDGTTTVRYIYEGKSDSDVAQNKTSVIDKRMEDIIFSRIVMIVEGETDRRLLSAILSRMRSSSDSFQTWIKQLRPTVQLTELTSLLKDITVVCAGTKDALSQVIEPLETLNIPYFMVVDGDCLFHCRSVTAYPGNTVMQTKRIINLFSLCDVLKDKDRVEDLARMFSDGIDKKTPSAFTGSISKLLLTTVDQQRMGDMKPTLDSHKNNKCNCGKHCNPEDGSSIISGSKSTAARRLSLILEGTFKILLPREDWTTLLPQGLLNRRLNIEEPERIDDGIHNEKESSDPAATSSLGEEPGISVCSQCIDEATGKSDCTQSQVGGPTKSLGISSQEKRPAKSLYICHLRRRPLNHLLICVCKTYQ